MISLDFDTREMERELRGMAGRIKDMAPVAEDFGAHMVRTWTLKFPRTPGHTPSQPGEPPAWQSGGLSGSLTHQLRAGGEAVEMGTAEKHGAIQHFGGEIRPRRARALTVPIAEQSYGKRARDFKDLFRIPPGEGEEPEDLGVLAQRTASGRIILLFALRGKVTIPARPWRIIYAADLVYLGKRMERHVAAEA